ncbi:hypothetical protein [Vibrio nereis]|uniref:hypothetical protein n=1 Tax=Vibrio nereis TaxID=693 RepID=UPI0024954576|nr:hypothetical protein [Vibrio nereis]
MLRSFCFYQVILVFDQRAQVVHNPELGVPAVSHLFRQSPKLRVPAEMLGILRVCHFSLINDTQHGTIIIFFIFSALSHTVVRKWNATPYRCET